MWRMTVWKANSKSQLHLNFGQVVLDDENLYYPEEKIRHVDYQRQRSGSDGNESDEEFRSLEMKEQEIL